MKKFLIVCLLLSFLVLPAFAEDIWKVSLDTVISDGRQVNIQFSITLNGQTVAVNDISYPNVEGMTIGEVRNDILNKAKVYKNSYSIINTLKNNQGNEYEITD